MAEPLGGGITNHNYKVRVADQELVLRVGGKDTELLGIVRDHEHEAALMAAGLGIGPEVVRFEHGCLVTRFVEGEVGSPDPAAAGALLRTLHGGPPIAARFDSFRVVEVYAETARARGVEPPTFYDDALETASRIEEIRRGEELVTCHNDLLAANFIDDVERAAAAAPYAVFDNAGQDCCARSRILVERSAYDRFAELLVEATGRVRVGDPADGETEIGPLISAQHRETVGAFVDAEPLFRGTTPDGPGYWYPCTLVEATNDDRIAREEVFGPVAALIPFDDEADAIRIANDTPYGLSGSIWTRDGAKALRVARALDTGVISVNSNGSVRVQTPFGGFKQSGFGRELGMNALDGYSEVKSVFIQTEGA